jgi:hypothetical protein
MWLVYGHSRNSFEDWHSKEHPVDLEPYLAIALAHERGSAVFPRGCSRDKQ